MDGVYLVWKHRTHDGSARYGLERRNECGQWEALSGHDSSEEAKAAAEAGREARVAAKRRHAA
ncbi:MAG: hypothetical protein HY749_16180 [Gammaproteobacteria bacterium]|nr:hypothetical protein [Gammaproteobacteria bacterium]